MTSIFSSLLDKMGGTPKPAPRAEVARASSSDSTISVVTVEDVDADASHAQSSSSTPPTSIGDSVSISSSIPLEKTNPPPVEEFGGRSRRQRTSVGTYNVKVLSGTAIHAPKKYCKNKPETGNETRRKTISGPIPSASETTENASSATGPQDTNRIVSDGIDALNLDWSVKKSHKQIGLPSSPKKTPKALDTGREQTANTPGEPSPSVIKRSVLGKRSRTSLDDSGLSGRAQRELKRLADTNEFAGIETKPVIYEVWKNGKLVVPGQEEPKKTKSKPHPAQPTAKVSALAPVQSRSLAKSQAKSQSSKIVAAPVVPEPAEVPKIVRKKEKAWLPMGLYAGQEFTENLNWFKGYKGPKDVPPFRPDGILPLPMWHGQRLLFQGRDFKLPFDVCSPLPPGQAKPDEWRKTSSNRFVGEASALWKKSSLFDSFSSKCVCTPEGGCDEDCQNRIMLYECDDTNCASGRGRCTNRAFAQLQERRKEGGKYRIGVEVIKTADRGYGVRSNRCFNPNQIIVEYTGEIITEDECDRRMNEDYKNNECYYLMSFDQNMIIDATKGSIARFVNHSCRPNCRMVKWIVGGKPRMALFAGDNPIMSGDELTYDYNFDPFSAKNVQECRCGSDNCRGVLGPKPKPVKEAIKDAVKAGVKAVKRKAKELLGGIDSVDDEAPSPKRRQLKKATGVKRSSGSMKSVKGAAVTVKESMSTKLLSARQVVKARRQSSAAGKASKSIYARTYSKSTKTVSRRGVGMSAHTAPRGKKRHSKLPVFRSSMAKSSGGKKRSSHRELESGTIQVMMETDDGDYEDDNDDEE